jgi:phenylalanyl-tRNA synthetase alpha subunit
LPDVEKADDPDELDSVESAYLGKNGELRQILAGIGKLSAEDRPKVGAAANPIRMELEAAIASRRARLSEIALDVRLARETTDVTLPGRAMPRGSLHPLIETGREIARIWAQFGFVVYESPEVETDELNFELLNIPSDHPARDLWDTMYVAGTDHKYVLRTHTSPGQVRVMRSSKPPIRALLPGRCFRYEAVDASHGFEFFQVEGLMVDEGTTLATLRGLLDPSRLLPIHRAVSRVRHRLPDLRRLGLPGLQAHRLDDDPRRGHGPSAGAAQRRHRSRHLPGLRVRHGHGPHHDAAPRHLRPARLLPGRPALPGGVLDARALVVVARLR